MGLCSALAQRLGLSVSDLAQQLRQLLELPGRVSFFAQTELTDEECFDLTKLRGHHQCTDALLLAIAIQHQAKLLTLDRNIPWRAVCSAAQNDIRLLTV